MRFAIRAVLMTGVIVMAAGGAGALEHEFIELPDLMHPTVRGVPVDELRERYRAGDDEAAATVEQVLSRAEQWRDVGDEWWLDRVLPVTPLGMWTTACPIHPERCQDFSDVRWEWSLDEPFRLYCPLCEEEGREYPYYPNPDYPDDGTGCYPSDEVWRRTHSAEWGREHPGIPWDRWDGETHGYSDANYAFFFRGKWHHLAQTRIAKTVLPTLGEAWQVCAHVLPENDPRADDAASYARSVRSALLTLARAHLGDAYLRDIVGGEQRYRAMLDGFYEADPRAFEGYVPYTLEDGITGSEQHPADRSNADIYCDGSMFGDAYASGWLQGFAVVRDSYTEEGIAGGVLRATECLLAAHEDDAQRLREAGGEFDLKYGKLDYHVRPCSMLGFHNLDGRLMQSQFNLGVLFGDERIIGTVLDNYRYYLRNSVYGDGLSWEGSPAYTNCTWNTMSYLMDASRGAHVVPRDHPWWSERLQGLDLYRAQALCNSLSKMPLSCLPNGRQIAWEDSHAAARPQLGHLQRSVRAGATIPEDCGELFDVSGEPGRQTVALANPAGFPSVVLHNNRKAVMRMPLGESTDVMALDYTWPVGHWHRPPLTLMWYTRDQEVLTDLGYMGAMHRLTREWIKLCPSHNTCVVRAADGSHSSTHLLRGDPTGLMADAGWVQVVEVAEQIPENLAELGESGVYGRTVAQIAAGEDASYLLDIFRVRGGAHHEWYLHGDGEALAVDGCPMEALEPEVTLAEHWQLEGGEATAWRHISGLEAGRTSGQWSATWAPLRTWDSGEKQVREALAYRCTMLPGGETTLVTGIAPGQRYTDNRDLNAKLPVLCARRENASAVDAFVAIHETIEGPPLIADATLLPAPEGTVAVRVDRGEEVDYLVSRSWEAAARDFAVDTPDGTLRLTGRFAAVSVAAGQVRRAFVAGQGNVALGDFELACPAGPRGRLVAFDDEADVLVIRPQSDWPTDGSLSGSWGVVRHHRGTSTFTVREVTPGGDGTVRIALKYTPHLVLNTVRATGLEGEDVLVEPRPAHPWRTRTSEPNLLGFQVYRRTAHGLERIGEMAGQGGISARDNWGKVLGPTLPTISVDGDASLVQPGDELLITRLRPNEDSVAVMPSASLEVSP